MPTLRQIKRRHDARTLHRWRFLADLRAEMSEWPAMDDDGDETGRACWFCNGDGTDPWNGYILPCPVCGDDVSQVCAAVV